jgi:hypothetical protein
MSRDIDSNRVQATARVRLTIDIPVPDTWGGDCDVAQVKRQATRAAGQIVEHVIETREQRGPHHMKRESLTTPAVCGLCGASWPCEPSKADVIVRRETELGVLLAHGKARIVDADVLMVLVEREQR